MKDIPRLPGPFRGPAARRGLQYTEAPLAEILDTLAKAQARMRLIDGLLRSSGEPSTADGELPMTRSELTALRREMLTLQTDLRAELRRRGEW